MKWNESGSRPLLFTYSLNWARRTTWLWWGEWDNTAFLTQDSKFKPWRSEAEHATSRCRIFTNGWGRNRFVSFKPQGPGNEPRSLAWKAAVLTTTLGAPPRLHKVHIIWANSVWLCLPLSILRLWLEHLERLKATNYFLIVGGLYFKRGLIVEVLRSKNPPKCSDCDKSTKFHTQVPFHLLNHIRRTPQAILTRKMS